jgi:hypothetical protein
VAFEVAYFLIADYPEDGAEGVESTSTRSVRTCGASWGRPCS